MTNHNFQFANKIEPCSRLMGYRIKKGRFPPDKPFYHGRLPFAEMKVGDSFRMPYNDYSEYERYLVTNAVWRLNKICKEMKLKVEFDRIRHVHKVPVRFLEIARIQ